ncbi:hypothetical protein H6G89_13480 [Oscillatoria sp. FACHB-1407]|uniref:DUF7219 family protein n=1 Tax=Oscillatoria sp. FACHB-1407 TaxID=2692847 RepID=UPI001687BB4F|nr:hypothetical protein [Oscillatoria sp. FACHB-1407]MBD2462060.1 hypothetical protein [Oscillatoria sp. FACHB-1407]
MTNDSDSSKDQFLNPLGRFRGEFTPENLAFDANLQEFANRVSILCSLETGGKISPVAAYEEIKQLWAQLETSKENLLEQDED